MEIFVRFENTYGTWRCYALCPKGKTFARMVGCKTLNRAALLGAHDLGYFIVECDRFGKPVHRHPPETRGSTLPAVL